DASYRYERGVDPALQYKAMERATRLLSDICGGEAGPVSDITSEATLPKRATITLLRSKLDRLIGHRIADEQVTDIM
ncbi:phenylalanine--tRNA ligase beta subunit-related protein, partial [Escherichia coli]